MPRPELHQPRPRLPWEQVRVCRHISIVHNLYLCCCLNLAPSFNTNHSAVTCVFMPHHLGSRSRKGPMARAYC